MLREWLRIARSQTAAALIMLSGIFYLIGGGNLFTLMGLAIIVFAILAHDFSFAHNSIIDVLSGYDTKDKGKTHFPLCNGTVDPYLALKIDHLGMLLVTVYAIFLAFHGTGNPALAISFFSLFILGGFWYNEWTSKITVWDFIPISMCFTSFSLYCFFLVSEEFTLLILLCAIYIFLLEWYEVSVAGEIKEAEADEVGMLKKLGMTCDLYMNLGTKAYAYAWTVKLLNVIVLALIFGFYNQTWHGLIMLVLMGVAMLYVSDKLIEYQKRERDRSIRLMALEEILSIFALPLVLIPIIDILQALVLIFFSLFYFFFMNKLNWGTILKPRV